MARKDRRTSPHGRLRSLLDKGDHRRARAEAQATLADASASADAREEAAQVIASLSPDRGVLTAGLIGVAIAIALAIFTLVAG